MNFAARVRRSLIPSFELIFAFLCGQRHKKLEREIRLVYSPLCCQNVALYSAPQTKRNIGVRFGDSHRFTSVNIQNCTDVRMNFFSQLPIILPPKIWFSPWITLYMLILNCLKETSCAFEEAAFLFTYRNATKGHGPSNLLKCAIEPNP